MLYLTRMRLDPATRAVLLDVGDPARVHSRVMSMFPDEGDSATRSKYNVLWRLENPPSSLPHLLVQASVLPKFERLPATYLAGRPEVRDLAPVAGHLAAGQALAFRFIGNVIVQPNGGAKRIGVKDRAEQLAWLARKAAGCGFTVAAGANGQPDVVSSTLPAAAVLKPGHRFHVFRVRFDGRLVVADADLLWRAMTVGVGKGRAYGCGLLTVAPPGVVRVR